MQILTDEGVSNSTVKILQELGHTVLRVQELQLEGAGDRVILERAHAESFVLLTHDLDYNAMLAASGARQMVTQRVLCRTSALTALM